MRWGMILTLFGLLCLPVMAQTQPSPKATAVGQCAVSHTGNGDVINITSCGIGKEQGEKIIQLLKNVANKKDLVEINAKLDELVEASKKPVLQIMNCNGGNCVQGTQVNYQVSKPLPNVTITNTVALAPEPQPHPVPLDPKSPNWRQELMQRSMINPLSFNPGAKVVFTVDAAFVNPMFLVWCDRPCAPMALLFADSPKGAAFGSGTFGGGAMFARTSNPDIFLTQFGTQNMMAPGIYEDVDIRSLDGQPISVVKVEAYAP